MTGLTWKTIAVTASPDSMDRVEQLLWNAGAVSVTAEDAGDEPILEPAPGTTPLWRDIVVTGLFEDEVDLAHIRQAMIDGGFNVLFTEELPDRQWEREWLSQFRPMCFGERLWVCPTAFDPPEQAEVVMYLDPGLAFGTGTHPTTRLCLEWLDARVRPGMKVLDYGCGSGILGIAALLLGAGHSVAVDNDRQALDATLRNAARNDVASSVTACLPEALPAGQYDVVIANILAQPLVSLAQKLESLLVPGGRIVLSGIMESQVDWVRSAYTASVFAEPAVLEGWACLEGRRK